MTMKLLVLIAVLVSGFFTACARSNNSDSANSQVSGPVNSTVAKVESASFTTANQSICGPGPGLIKMEGKTDSVHLYMNKDDSAVLKETMLSICRYQGKISNISLEKKGDTLLVSIDYHEYPQDSIHHPVFKCAGRNCSADYEINVPAEFVGARFVSVSYNGKVMLSPIAYVKE